MPNVVILLADQWRAQALGYAGDPNVKTPNLDRLSRESINFTHAVSGCPVCSPARAGLLTGQHPLTHGVFVNDVCLSNKATSLAQAYKGAGYDTAYIGKWHLDGHGRTAYIPPERRQGFDYWKVLECTHDYNHSPYYEGDSEQRLCWEGYDAFAQTRDAQHYIRTHDHRSPFLLVLSWGPPHNPYETAPREYGATYAPENITLRPNVPPHMAQAARRDLAGYYAHCSALDACVGDVSQTLQDAGIADDTILVFMSDHGDMLGSQGRQRKQVPWDESIRVPFLLRAPFLKGQEGKRVDVLLDMPDIMPTLLGLCGIHVPDTVEGLDFSGHLRGGPAPSAGSALMTCPHPFGEFHCGIGGREYRGVCTGRYTYVRSHAGPWLLYDNKEDEYQQKNLTNIPEYAELQAELDDRLQRKLAVRGDEFLRGEEYVQRWGYPIDETGTVPYTE